MLGAPIIGVLAVLAQVDVAAGVATEAGGGKAPLVAGQQPETSVRGAVEPAVIVRVGPKQTRVSLRYRPRLTWQRPNPIERQVRPLVLHVIDLGALHLFKPSTSLELLSNVSVGEPDYTTLQGLVGATEGAALPPVPNLLFIENTATFALTLDSRTIVGARAGAVHRRALGDDPPAMTDANGAPVMGPQPLPKQTQLSLGPYASYRITPVDQIDLSTDFSYEWRDPKITFFVAFVAAGWSRKLTRNHELALLGGLAYTRTAQTPVGSDTRSFENGFSPVGTLSYLGVLAGGRGYTLTSSLNLGVESVVDPILTIAGPRSHVTARLGLRIGHTRLGLESDFSTSLRGDPQPIDAMMPDALRADETTVSAALSIERQVSPAVVLALRARWSDRAQHLEDPAFKFHQRELWLSLSAAFATRTLNAPAASSSTPPP